MGHMGRRCGSCLRLRLRLKRGGLFGVEGLGLGFVRYRRGELVPGKLEISKLSKIS
jgi:hypothetical protein